MALSNATLKSNSHGIRRSNTFILLPMYIFKTGAHGSFARADRSF